jgi:thiamine biosynthesis lipoprotein
VVVGGDADLPDVALRRLADLEASWSRFRADSELSRLNDAAGTPCIVSGDTALLVSLFARAWRDTNGRFDPTQSDALIALGYGRSWPDGVDGEHACAAPRRSVGCADVRVDRRTNLVWLPAGIRLDPGGLGKGLAADLVVRELRAAGADGALVNVGGDLRVWGRPPEGDAWHVRVEHPGDPDASVADVVLANGGVATTSRARRAWTLADGTVAHHVLDPADGLPARVPWVSATVVAGSAWEAEVGAKVAFLDGTLQSAYGVAGALVFEDGSVRPLRADQSHIMRARAGVPG